MKKIIPAMICVSLLTACGGAADNADMASVSETSLMQESMTEESVTEESTASESEAAPEKGEKPKPPQERKTPDNMYRVTAVDGNTITCEKVMGGRGFGGGFRGRMPEKGELPEGEKTNMPENSELPEGGRPDMPDNGRLPEGERPQPETVTITITDSTELDGEIKAGDMITAELNEDNSAVSVKIADMPAAPEKSEEAESETSSAE
ncbi:MAG: hypothetical protein J6A37_08710 [Oscillospiraceae bacterium]|nr:hypothetical protein [Oscillospiraceae bacterium]MBP1546667.1 hypothetical protein [Oscillospiraceae bacterium]